MGGSPAFTLVELLVTMAILAILAALTLPGMARTRKSAKNTQCLSNLRQHGFACQMYWDDHNGQCFGYQLGFRDDGDVYWFGWISRGREGSRLFDPKSSVLTPYLGTVQVSACPARQLGQDFKPKAAGRISDYGYNWNLSPGVGEAFRSIRDVLNPSGLVVFADSAQINTFQAPASPANPMIEEFYYVSTTEPTTHFRHQIRSQVVLADGHAEGLGPKPETWDTRMPQHHIGRLREEKLALR